MTEKVCARLLLDMGFRLTESSVYASPHLAQTSVDSAAEVAFWFVDKDTSTKCAEQVVRDVPNFGNLPTIAFVWEPTDQLFAGLAGSGLSETVILPLTFEVLISKLRLIGLEV